MAKITWNKIITKKDWQKLAQTLAERAKQAASDNDAKAMQSVSDEMRDFLSRRTMACPQEVTDAVFHAETELNRLIAADVAGSIASRTVQLNAYLDDIKQAGERIEAQAKFIRLEVVKDAVDSGTLIIADLKELRTLVNDGGTPAEIANRVKDLTSSLQDLVKALNDASN